MNSPILRMLDLFFSLSLSLTSSRLYLSVYVSSSLFCLSDCLLRSSEVTTGSQANVTIGRRKSFAIVYVAPARNLLSSRCNLQSMSNSRRGKASYVWTWRRNSLAWSSFFDCFVFCFHFICCIQSLIQILFLFPILPNTIIHNQDTKKYSLVPCVARVVLSQRSG